MNTPANQETARPGRWFSGRALLVDLAIAIAILAGTGAWGTWFWNSWTSRGNQGVFYQTYFEPAVMVACGKGWVISHPQPKALEEFLFQRRDDFACEEIPADNRLDTQYLYQGAWKYLLVSVGWGWRLLGISWSGMGPLFGLAFGLVAALAYGIFRLAMGRAVAVAMVVCLAISPTQLLNLPHLRDYAKAPFTLALVFIVGLLVTQPVRRWLVVALAAAYGVTLGIGYGFRTDFLVALPVFVVALFGFLEGGITKHLALKLVSTVVFLATFVTVSWPITSSVLAQGGCQWHVTLLGLQSPFDGYLLVKPAPYDFGHAYSDSYIDRMVNGYHWRTVPGSDPLVFCSHEYDVQSGRYLGALLTTFPADFVTRAYGSVLQVVEMPFSKSLPPMADWASPLYTLRTHVVDPSRAWGFWLTVLTLLMVSAASLRVAIVLLFFLAYFGGYPAIQFQERHYFHLEFIGLFSLGMVVHAIISAVGTRSWPNRAVLVRGAVQAAVFAVATIVVVVGALTAIRWYQAGQVRALLGAYIAAPKTAVESPASPLVGIGANEWPQLLEVNLNQAACGEKPAITFHYDKKDVSIDFSRTMTIERASSTPGVTRIFLPVYANYTGLELAEPRDGCITGVSRVTDLHAFPILVAAMLPPGWESLPLYQRLAAWESAPSD